MFAAVRIGVTSNSLVYKRKPFLDSWPRRDVAVFGHSGTFSFPSSQMPKATSWILQWKELQRHFVLPLPVLLVD